MLLAVLVRVDVTLVALFSICLIFLYMFDEEKRLTDLANLILSINEEQRAHDIALMEDIAGRLSWRTLQADSHGGHCRLKTVKCREYVQSFLKAQPSTEKKLKEAPLEPHGRHRRFPSISSIGFRGSGSQTLQEGQGKQVKGRMNSCFLTLAADCLNSKHHR